MKNQNDYKHVFYNILRIRKFETMLLDFFLNGLVFGTIHTCIGQEAVALALADTLLPGDIVFASHRCHGYFLARGGSLEALLGEIMCRKNGVCGGISGVQHINSGNFFSNGIQGGIVPNLTGMAYAEKIKGNTNIGVTVLGDGTLGQGIVYESFNIASLLDVPVLFLVEDNGYAMSTATEKAVAGSISSRAKAFNIACEEIHSNDYFELYDVFLKAVNYVRKEKRPYCLIVRTYRLGPHSKGDEIRSEEELLKYKFNDPLEIAKTRLSDEAFIDKAEKQVEEELKNAYKKCLQSEKAYFTLEKKQEKRFQVSVLNVAKHKKCVTALNEAFFDIAKSDKNIIFLGEDICDPYGGAFKVTKGLATHFGQRVLNMPISEAGFTGLAIGLAANGIKPIVEIMFGDFISLCFDQILNHAVKYSQLYKIKLPLVLRTPSGGGRGYGPTHSQSLEKYFIGIPGLIIVALCPLHEPKELLKQLLNDLDSPLLFIENKMMYSRNLLVIEKGRCGDFFIEFSEEGIFRCTLDPSLSADIAIITYGGMVETAMIVAEMLLINYEIRAEVIVHTILSSLEIQYTVKYTYNIPNLAVLEEGTLGAGWGAEIIAQISTFLPGKKYLRIATTSSAIPSGNCESSIFPNSDKIIQEIKEFLNFR